MVFLQKLLGDLPAAQIMIFRVNARRLMTGDIGTLLLLSGKTSFNHTITLFKKITYIYFEAE